MALQGTIDTFELTEVVRLLAAGSKTGVLRLDGSRGTGGVWVKDGQVTKVAVDHAPHATDHAEAMFELLRFDDGSFTFESGPEADEPDKGGDVDAILADAEAKLAEWREIERVVPTTRATVTLRPELSRADVVLDKTRWRLVAAIGGGATVATVGESLGLGELPVSRAVKDLIELGVVDLDDSVVAEPVVVAPDPVLEPEPVAVDEPDPLADVFVAQEPELVDADPFGGVPVPSDPGSARAQLDEFAVGFGLSDAPPMDATLVDTPAEQNGFSDFGMDPAGPLDEPLFGDSDPLGDFVSGLPDLPVRDAGGADGAFDAMANGNGANGHVNGFGEPTPSPLLGAGNDAAEVARQLSNLSPAAARAVAAAAKATTDEEREAALAQVAQDGDEPIDRELLLRFLASVKS